MIKACGRVLVYCDNLVVINSMVFYNFVDPGLRVEIFFKKEGTAENGNIDFEIGDLGTFAHLYWRLR